MEENITETPQKGSTLLKKTIKGTLDSHIVGVKELLSNLLPTPDLWTKMKAKN